MTNETKLATNPTTELTDVNTPQVVAPTAQVEDLKNNDLALLFEEMHTIPTGYTPVKVLTKFTTKVEA